VDISNAHSSENDILKNKIKQLENENIKLIKGDNALIEMFNLQSSLFILLILMLVLISYYYN
jgi:hypothetical protein